MDGVVRECAILACFGFRSGPRLDVCLCGERDSTISVEICHLKKCFSNDRVLEFDEVVVDDSRTVS